MESWGSMRTLIVVIRPELRLNFIPDYAQVIKELENCKDLVLMSERSLD